MKGLQRAAHCCTQLKQLFMKTVIHERDLQVKKFLPARTYSQQYTCNKLIRMESNFSSESVILRYALSRREARYPLI